MSKKPISTFEIPLFHMRGGTSTGVVLNQGDLPSSKILRDDVIRKIMGVPDLDSKNQITGLGRGTPTSNKLFIVEVLDSEKCIVKSTLAQLATEKPDIDWGVNCGNMSSAIPLYLVENKLISYKDGINRIEIVNTNTNKSTNAYINLSKGKVSSYVEIPGAPGYYPAVTLELNEPVGAKTGKLFPTGNSIDVIDGIEVTCLDVNVPMVIVNAQDLGKTAYESVDELSQDQVLRLRLQKLWTLAGLKMQLRSVSGALLTKEELAESETIPKICIISPSKNGHDINTRYFTPQKPHNSLAVSGGGCLAAACISQGTIAHKMMQRKSNHERETINIENPSGVLDIELILENEKIKKILYQRNAQVLVKGHAVIYS